MEHLRILILQRMLIYWEKTNTFSAGNERGNMFVTKNEIGRGGNAS